MTTFSRLTRTRIYFHRPHTLCILPLPHLKCRNKADKLFPQFRKCKNKAGKLFLLFKKCRNKAEKLFLLNKDLRNKAEKLFLPFNKCRNKAEKLFLLNKDLRTKAQQLFLLFKKCRNSGFSDWLRAIRIIYRDHLMMISETIPGYTSWSRDSQRPETRMERKRNERQHL